MQDEARAVVATEPEETPAPEKPKPPKAEVAAAGQTLLITRQMLGTVSMAVLEGAVHEIAVHEVMAPLLDPTRYRDEDQARDFMVQKEAAIKLLELKRVWGQHEGRL